MRSCVERRGPHVHQDPLSIAAATLDVDVDPPPSTILALLNCPPGSRNDLLTSERKVAGTAVDGLEEMALGGACGVLSHGCPPRSC